MHGIERVVAGDLVVDQDCFADGSTHGDDDESEDLMFSSVREVTQEEASAGVFSMTDVVLPLPGSRVMYSERLKTMYDDMCKADGVQLVGHAHAVREYSLGFLTGAYRRLIIKPDKIDFSFVRYSDPRADLTETDMVRITFTYKLPSCVCITLHRQFCCIPPLHF
jgi:tRNA pseudouridine13 synthase